MIKITNQIQQYFLICCIAFFAISCNKNTNPSLYQTDTTEISQNFEEEEEIVEMILPYKDQLDAAMKEVIGVFAHDMYKGSLPEGELGNFMCDAPMELLLEKYPEFGEIDFTLMNFGGIRTQHIPAGEITVEQMFELMPFENELVIVEVQGAVFVNMMRRVAEKGGWPISKNVNLAIENQEVRDFLIDGEPVDWDKTYRVLLSDYVANGGDGMSMLQETKKITTGIKLRDALIEYVRGKYEQQEMISSRINGRVIVIE